ncbi:MULTISPECIES: nickel-responsive transcriptional regulator NikR [Anaeromyxobacter]|uniref:Putative nickel-responsive regulator n=1 Tax=Anaeromyxobacter dehalogenans (strain 2CP-C) TaxID=290397 RepID=NIKR_ANADE|nr:MULTISPECIES: nickel-responsive transcriptional regulator NikR [Anaeromyxobacter]Q2IN94.1 RecName: Full=Putative nickel-responsive regulator [Anaeromyxobacter dehalogenans 2CP-C]ABC80273.1 transcriptional regulator, CopG family [Anaeromyxobacter dehalogenans 2CP-C]GAO04823.1 putative nickel-responsive regulator [Anaeromyxobacter sp. PSR-1]
MLERIGISLEDGLLEQFDKLIAEKGYVNRSEAVRDLIRDALVQRAFTESSGREERVAVVTLVYDHDSSSLAQKLAHIQHENHRAVVSALHVHMDAHNCLEVLVLRGRGKDVVAMGESLVATKGVKYGKLVPATAGHDLR